MTPAAGRSVLDTEGQCPGDMDMMCPNGAMRQMASGNGGEGSDKGCQCVPDFLMAMVMTPVAGRSVLDRSKGKVTFKIKKTTCKCDYEINAGNCQKSKFTCDKKCNGNAKGIAVEGGMYVFDLAVKKGKVKVAKCKKEAGSEPGTGGSGNGGAGSGSGNGGEGAGASRCACVSKGMGGTGPSPPTGSGSGPSPPTGSGSGSAPTGSGSGTGSGSPAAAGPYTPGQPGGPWTEPH